jgi:hypothetical protein
MLESRQRRLRRHDRGGAEKSRASAFAVFAVVAAIAITISGVIVLSRPRRGSGAAEAGARASEWIEPYAAARTSGRAPARAEARWPAPAADDAAAPGADPAVMVVRKRNLLIVAHEQQLLEEADERALGAMHASEALRTSIRQINEDWAEAKRAQLSADSPGRTPEQEEAAAGASNAGLDRARAVEVENLLGTAGLREFESAERDALTRVRERFHGWAERTGRSAETEPPIDFARPLSVR